MFFKEKSLIFQEIIDLISGVDIIISAAWGQISACFKNLTPWFCSLENPGFCIPKVNKFFASLWLWQESLRNMFFEEKSLIFQEIIDLISGVDIII